MIEWAGKPIHAIRKGLERLVANAGLPDITAHVSIHTAVVHMAASGVLMAQISQYLGHSSTAVTEQVYARFAPDHLRRAAEILDFGKDRRMN